MKKSRFTEEQIVGILREHEPGTATDELGRLRVRDAEPNERYFERLPSGSLRPWWACRNLNQNRNVR